MLKTVQTGTGGGGGSSNLVVGTTTITGGTSGNIVYDNAGVVGELSTSGANSVVKRDANQNVTANSFYAGTTSVAASGTAITMTASSTPAYIVTGSGGQTINLPDATTLPVGAIFTFNNNQSSGTIVVKVSGGGSTVSTIQAGSFVEIVLLSNGSAAGTWDTHYLAPSNAAWSTNTLSYPGAITGITSLSSSGSLTTGTSGSAQGSLVLNNTSAYSTTLKSSNSATAAYTLTLPTTAGTLGYVLSTDGTGVASWVNPATATTLTVGSTPTSGGAAGQIMFDTGSVLSESSNLVWDNTNKALTLGGGTQTGSTLTGVAITGTAGQFSCTAASPALVVGQLITISGTFGGTGSITGYSNPTNYYISATNGSTTFTLVTTGNAAIVTTAGTPTGLTYAYSTTPVINATQTWNSSTTPFTALKLNVTNTASNAASLLMDLQVGGTSQFNVSESGAVIVGYGVKNATSNLILQSANNNIYYDGNYHIFRTSTQASYLQFSFNVITSSFPFALGATSTSPDVYLSRRAAANLNLGAADAAAPVAQTLSVQSVVAGTSNTAGANFTIAGSQGTGTGAGGSIIFQTAPAGTTGTAQNALATSLSISPSITTIRDAGANATIAKFSNAGGLQLFAAGSAGGGIQIASGSSGFASAVWYNAGGGFALGQINSQTGSIALASAAQYGWVSTTTVPGTTATLDTILGRTSAGIVYVNGASSAPGTVVTGAYSASGTAIPSASTAGIGARAFVSDATATTFGTAYTSGGSNKVPVYSDGTSWYIG